MEALIGFKDTFAMVPWEARDLNTGIILLAHEKIDKQIASLTKPPTVNPRSRRRET